MQGSGLGPCLYIIYASDLRSRGKSNDIVKYADDASLRVIETIDVLLEDEFLHSQKWAADNKLMLQNKGDSFCSTYSTELYPAWPNIRDREGSLG